MKSLLVVVFFLSLVSSAEISIETVLKPDKSGEYKHSVVLNSKGCVSALLRGKQLLPVDSARLVEPLYTFPWTPHYVLYEQGKIFAVKDTILLVVDEKGGKEYTIPHKVCKIAPLNESELILQSGFAMRLSMLHRFSLASGTIVGSYKGYSNWVLDDTSCYFIAIDSVDKPNIYQMDRSSFTKRKKWELWGRPNSPMILSKNKLRVVMVPPSTGPYSAKLDLFSVHLEDGKLYKNDLGFTAGGSGDVQDDILILEDSKYDLVLASRGSNRLVFYSGNEMHEVSLQPYGGFGEYYLNALYQHGTDIYVLHGKKLFIYDLREMAIKKSITLKQCGAIIDGDDCAYLQCNTGIKRIVHKKASIEKPMIKAYPWYYGGELLWSVTSENPWRFDSGRSKIVCTFPEETYISRITLLDCNVKKIQEIQFRWNNGVIEPINGYRESLKGDVVLTENVGYYTDELTLEIRTESGDINTIGGIVFE